MSAPARWSSSPRVASAWQGGIFRLVAWACGWLLAGALLTALVYQIPARHVVAVGRNDETYVQGFADAANRWGVVTDQTGVATPLRWTGPDAALIFPQIGLPAELTLRVRGWRPPGSEAPRVRVLLNGRQELASFVADETWQQHTFPLNGGLWKPRDLFVKIVVDPLLEQDDRQLGVQLDRAVLRTTGWPILPYPAQLAGGALAGLLGAVRFRSRPRLAASLLLLMQAAFLLLYRLDLIAYPLRLFWPGLIVLLLISTVIHAVERHLSIPSTPARLLVGARLWRLAAFAVLVLWLLAIGWGGRHHVVLSLPGVEKDFRVFATRSEALQCPPGALEAGAHCVLRADGFYQLGYPLLLWLVRPIFAGNPFMAGRLIALLSATLLVGATWGLSWGVLGRSGHLAELSWQAPRGRGVPRDAVVFFAGMAALLFVVLNRWTAEYALLLGTDMPFAAVWTLALLAMVVAGRSPRRALGAGMLCGLAFLLRHPGLLLLPLGLGLLWWRERPARWWRSPMAAFLLGGFLLAALPQLIVNTQATGRPFYSEQPKNIWLAVYGNTDWGRWQEARDDIGLWQVVRHEPLRFLGSWWSNLRGFWGTGSEDTGEFGRSLALRLLAFPANLLAAAGLVVILMRGRWRSRFLLAAAMLYVAGIAVGFLLPRFVLPLVPIWAVAAALAVDELGRWARHRTLHTWPGPRLALWTGCLLLLLLLGAPSAGIGYVLDRQDPEQVAVVELIRQVVLPGERLEARVPPDDFVAKYSAISHLVVPAGNTEARYVLWSTRSDQSPPAGAEPLGRAGRYALYRTHATAP